MRVVLRADVDGVGKKGDIMDVADGFARNFLIPKGLGLRATTGTERQASAMRRTRELRDAQERGAAELGRDPPDREGREGMAEVEPTGGRRGEAGDHGARLGGRRWLGKVARGPHAPAASQAVQSSLARSV